MDHIVWSRYYKPFGMGVKQGRAGSFCTFFIPHFSECINQKLSLAFDHKNDWIVSKASHWPKERRKIRRFWVKCSIISSCRTLPLLIDCFIWLIRNSRTVEKENPYSNIFSNFREALTWLWSHNFLSIKNQLRIRWYPAHVLSRPFLYLSLWVW